MDLDLSSIGSQYNSSLFRAPRSLSENSVVCPRARHFFVWQSLSRAKPREPKQAMLVLSSMQPDTARRKKGRSKPDRVLGQDPSAVSTINIRLLLAVNGHLLRQKSSTYLSRPLVSSLYLISWHGEITHHYSCYKALVLPGEIPLLHRVLLKRINARPPSSGSLALLYPIMISHS